MYLFQKTSCRWQKSTCWNYTWWRIDRKIAHIHNSAHFRFSRYFIHSKCQNFVATKVCRTWQNLACTILDMHFTRKNISSSNHKTFWELMSFVIAIFKEETTLGLLQIWMATKRFIEKWLQLLQNVYVLGIWCCRFLHTILTKSTFTSNIWSNIKENVLAIIDYLRIYV